MKIWPLLLAIAILISVPLNVFADSRIGTIIPKLSISGTTATCQATVTEDKTSDYIQVNMKLMYGNSCIASWSDDGYGFVYMSKTATVTAGRTYTLVVEVTVNGVENDPVSTTKTC